MTSAMTSEFLALQEILAGRYSLERELGRGGMGIVLLARDVALDRPVAIKLLPPDAAEVPEVRERFLREARTAAGLSHPNIVPIHSVEEHGRFVFFVMGYVDGESLRQRVERSGPLTVRQATKFMQEVAWALAYAHERGVVHRDIKPDNIMLERDGDRAIVMDFGIATVGPQRPSAEIVGTARYMSPEQATGEMVDRRSDLYSLGATFFYALAARAPFEATSMPALLASHVSEPAPPVREFRAEVPARFNEIIQQCLAKDPADRFPSGDELAKALGDIRGREFRAPPLLRRFMRNAEISTALLLAGTAMIQGGRNGFGINIIFFAILVQLGSAARRLLREGYTFEDIRAALLAESQLHREESEAIQERKIMRWVMSLWLRVWAGKFGRTFFRVAGTGLKKPKQRAVVGAEPTEFAIGRAATEAFDALPAAQRKKLGGVREAIGLLEERAEVLRAGGDTGARLTQAVAALEKVRIGLLRLQAGTITAGDLTQQVAEAREIGERVNQLMEAQEEVKQLLA
jgi:hypothetical protein